MIYNGTHNIGKIALGSSEIGEVYFGTNHVYSSGIRYGDLEVGTVVQVPYNDVMTNFIVVHQGNPDSSIYDASCNGTWLMKQDTYQVNVDNSIAYALSNLHLTEYPAFYNAIGADFRRHIKQVKIPYGDKNGNTCTDKTLGNGLECYVFSLSCGESGYGWLAGSTIFGQGAKLDYFIQGNDATADAKRIDGITNSNKSWLTRGFKRTVSMNEESSMTYNYFAVLRASSGSQNPDTTVSAEYSKQLYVRPSFIVDKSAKVVTA